MSRPCYRSVLLPFSGSAWLAILLYLVVTGFLAYAIEKGNNDDFTAADGSDVYASKVVPMKGVGRVLQREHSTAVNAVYWTLANFTTIGSGQVTSRVRARSTKGRRRCDTSA